MCDVSDVWNIGTNGGISFIMILCVRTSTDVVHLKDVFICKFIGDRRGSIIKYMMQLIYVRFEI